MPVQNHAVNGQSPASKKWYHFTWLKGIRNQIAFGYAMALGVAVCGTMAGMAIGHYCYKQAHYGGIDVDNVGRELLDFHIHLLETQIHQKRLISLMQQPEQVKRESADFKNRIEELTKELSTLKSADENELEGLTKFIKNNEKNLTTYLEIQNKFITEVEQLSLQEKGEDETGKLLLQLAEKEMAISMPSLFKEIEVLIELSEELEDQKREQLEQGEELQAQIVILSMILSVIIAIILAIKQAEAIARPIQEITGVAKQVTEEANFDIQTPVKGSNEVGVLATSLNQLILKVKHLIEEVKNEQEAKIFQTEKMASLGRMIAEISHELNNPINCLYGNLDPLNTYHKELLDLIHIYQKEFSDLSPIIQHKTEEIELEFLEKDLMQIMDAVKFSAERAKEIVRSLKNFSRIDETKPHKVDLHNCLDSTLLILNNRIKQRVKIVKNYGNLPHIEGYSGLLSQVFINIIANAIDALPEKTPEQGEPQITIITEKLDDNTVVVRIADNGTGIPPEIQKKIFENFFTTKPIGVGTGLGLAISRQIVVKKHGGSITVKSELAKGTEFAIALPIQQVSSPAVSVKVDEIAA